MVKLDETVRKSCVWTAGQREECYVAVYCSQKCHMDHKAVKDAEVKETKSSKGVFVPVRGLFASFLVYSTVLICVTVCADIQECLILVK